MKSSILKEVLDKIGAGVTSPQFLNILFFQAGASLFLLGLIAGIKLLLDTVSSIFAEIYVGAAGRFSRKILVSLSILLGASFFALNYAVSISSPSLYAISLLVMGAAGVFLGINYFSLKEMFFSGRKLWIAIALSSFSLLIAGYAFDRYGFSYVLPIAGITFFLSSFFAVLLPANNQKTVVLPLVKAKLNTLTYSIKSVLKKKFTLLLLLTTLIIVSGQTLANAYYGVYIYETFFYIGFGGFMNVGIIFAIASLSSLFAPKISEMNIRQFGKFPMLVFGAVLMALTPLIYYATDNLLSILIGTMMGVIGGAISGMANGLFVNDVLDKDELKAYYSASSVLAVAGLILVALGAVAFQILGMRKGFLITGIAFALIAAIYFVIVAYNNRRNI